MAVDRPTSTPPPPTLPCSRRPSVTAATTSRTPPAGQGVANPIAQILSAALLLRHSLGLHAEAGAVEAAVDAVLAAGLRTRDLKGRYGGGAAAGEGVRIVGTVEMGAAVAEAIAKAAAAAGGKTGGGAQQQ